MAVESYFELSYHSLLFIFRYLETLNLLRQARVNCVCTQENQIHMGFTMVDTQPAALSIVYQVYWRFLYWRFFVAGAFTHG